MSERILTKKKTLQFNIYQGQTQFCPLRSNKLNFTAAATLRILTYGLTFVELAKNEFRFTTRKEIIAPR